VTVVDIKDEMNELSTSWFIYFDGDIIQAVGQFALEENCKYICIDWIGGISINMFFQVLITTK